VALKEQGVLLLQVQVRIEKAQLLQLLVAAHRIRILLGAFVPVLQHGHGSCCDSDCRCGFDYGSSSCCGSYYVTSSCCGFCSY
jgi:hypothetical protein